MTRDNKLHDGLATVRALMQPTINHPQKRVKDKPVTRDKKQRGKR